MHILTWFLIYPIIAKINKIILQVYIPITFLLQTAFHPQLHVRLNRRLFCRMITFQRICCRKIRKLGEVDVIKL